MMAAKVAARAFRAKIAAENSRSFEDVDSSELSRAHFRGPSDCIGLK